MKFMHLADLHIGKNINGYSLLDDQRHALGRIIEQAASLDVDALVLAGDLYDKSTPSAEATALLDWFFTACAAQGLKVLATPGNHDSAERVGYARHLLSREGIHLAGVYRGSIERIDFEDEFGPIAFWLVPFLKPAHVRPYHPDADIAQDYTLALEAALADAEIDPGIRNVCVAHQFVTSGSASPVRSDSEINVGGLDNVDARVFDRFDYVALGHIHRPQQIERPTIRYAGSLLKYSLSEANHAKSAVLVELLGKAAGQETGACAKLSFAPIEPLHDLRVVRGPIAAITSPEVAAEGDPRDYLGITITDENPPLDAIARIRALYPNVLSLEFDNARTREAQASSPFVDAAENLDPLELFSRFYREQNGGEITERQRALAQDALQAAGAMEGALR